MTFWLCVAGIVSLIERGTELELQAIGDPIGFASLVAVLGALALAARWRTSTCARSEDGGLRFDNVPEPAVQTLRLADSARR